MTGHHAQKRSLGARPAADHRLDQFAAQVAEARSTQPALQALAATEQQFIDTAMDIGAHLDRETVGAAWLILGQLFAANLASVAPEQQPQHLAMLLNVARLAGQRLYTGDRLPVETPCPFTYGTGAPCKTVIKAPNADRADVLLGAHVWQQHPGETWPPKPRIEGEHGAELTDLPPGLPMLPADGGSYHPQQCTHPLGKRAIVPGGIDCTACGAEIERSAGEAQ